ncbi:MAG: adenylate/guanylate cyclase domain-containing protein [Methanocellales archaeon]|nr:adenylate/guanylate cyclase domain-containing protein [Methanocellales archaeon]MDD3291992.1 adenylate/guanylate cyclase domain-containing protein [Methanocellales archaeon]MDD5235888.1 adenylate/guanylate cyclase domain-containing protein [Methanocellales archaeon]MDD5485453.1 adenylate/guanylate cyclase domain-containing protein [Methanocellales archaeon]
MHRQFREYLDTAEGHSEFIIVVFVDIRGFSAFSKRHESPDTAMYIKRVYKRLIDDYFNTASFYKSTGDGLLITIPYKETTLKEVASDTIKSCLRCYEEFAHICADDPMINFDVPSRIGIGISRGTACCLKSNDRILDYTGHILNMASRLTGLARPAGIVIDGDFKIEDLFDVEDQELFEKREAFLRSISEESPKTVYVMKDVVDIPPEYLQPLRRDKWDSIEQEKTIKQWKKYSPRYFITLENYLRRPNAIEVTLIYPPNIGGKIDSSIVKYHNFKYFEYREKAGQPEVLIYIDKMIEYLKSEAISQNRKVRLRIKYVPKIV